MKVVFDTNVWISSLLLAHSSAGLLIQKWEASQLDIVISPYILQEIKRVLAYPKINKRLQWDETKIQYYLDRLSFFAETFHTEDIYVHVPSDPKDSPILSLFIKSGADFLISGDKDLLSLKNEYAILSIAEFLRKLEAVS